MGANVQGKGGGSGSLSIKVIRGGGQKQAFKQMLLPMLLWLATFWESTFVLRWKIRNALTTRFIQGWFSHNMALLAASMFGWNIGISELRAVLIKADGRRIDLGVVSYRLVTNAFIALLIDDMDNASGGADISGFKYHGVGTGTTSESAGDTALVTESTTILTVNSTRATGTQTQPTSASIQSVATVSFDGSGAITEHGWFDNATVGSGTLCDRSVFSAINVVSSDGIQFTYTYTQTGS